MGIMVCMPERLKVQRPVQERVARDFGGARRAFDAGSCKRW